MIDKIVMFDSMLGDRRKFSEPLIKKGKVIAQIKQEDPFSHNRTIDMFMIESRCKFTLNKVFIVKPSKIIRVIKGEN